MRVSPATFRTLASTYLNSSFPEPKRSTLVTNRVYKAHFKLNPLQTARVWEKLEDYIGNTNCVYKTQDSPPQIVSWEKHTLPKHLLWTLHYMKTYMTEDQTAVLFATTNKTFRKYFWAMVHFLNVLTVDLVSNSLLRTNY